MCQGMPGKLCAGSGPFCFMAMCGQENGRGFAPFSPEAAKPPPLTHKAPAPHVPGAAGTASGVSRCLPTLTRGVPRASGKNGGFLGATRGRFSADIRSGVGACLICRGRKSDADNLYGRPGRVEGAKPSKPSALCDRLAALQWPQLMKLPPAERLAIASGGGVRGP